MPPTICFSTQNAKVETEHNSDQKFDQVIYTLGPNCLQNFMSLTQVDRRFFAYKIFNGLSLKRGITPPWRLLTEKKNHIDNKP